MSIQGNWLKFVISGKVDDYLKYADSRKAEEVSGGVDNSHFDGRSCNKGNEYRGKGYSDNPDDT
ncbi:MAG: hypothetical protein MJ076_04685 [Clostridia bacterium]|nr:hypothetical protein [Clostridia bacterium]